MKSIKLFFAVVCLAVIAGCGTTPPAQYYTLLPGVQKLQDQADKPYRVPNGAFAISVQPVLVPEQVDRPQLVLSRPGSAEVTVLNQSLWAAPLSDEIRNALVHYLSDQLGVLDVPLRAAPPSIPLWVVSLSVQRFDSLYDEQATLEATWTLSARNQPKAAVSMCRGLVKIGVGSGMGALVHGHQEALRQVADVIAARLSNNPLRASDKQIVLTGCTS